MADDYHREVTEIFLIIKTLIKTNAFLVSESLRVANAADVRRPNAWEKERVPFFATIAFVAHCAKLQ